MWLIKVLPLLFSATAYAADVIPEPHQASYPGTIVISATLIAVNGRAYKSDLVKSAITAAKESKQPIELLIKSDDQHRTVSIAYDQGLRYPHLERIVDVPDRLSVILQALQ